MKKIIALLIIAAILAIICACNNNTESTTPDPTSQTLTENINISTFSIEQATKPTQTSSTEITTTEITTPPETTTQTEATTTKEEEPTTETFPKIVDADTIIIDKITETHDYDKVILWLESDVDMDSFTEEFGIKYYKSIPLKYSMTISITRDGETTDINVKSHYMTIVKTDKGYIMADFYIGDGETKRFGTITFSCDDIKETLKNLEIGTTVESVMKIDPNGRYGFAHSSYIVYSKYSNHFFKDGTAIEIKYDDDLKVKEITLFYL